MINVMVRNALEGIVWKNEFEPRDYDSYLILPTYHAFFEAEHRWKNVYDMFRNIYNNKLRQKKERLHFFVD
jgi:hypothetical protein